MSDDPIFDLLDRLDAAEKERDRLRAEVQNLKNKLKASGRTKLREERDRLRELLSDIRAQGRITGDIAKRLIAALGGEKGNG